MNGLINLKRNKMTPKEKAEELFNKYLEIDYHYYQAKDCALIAVDEIIKASPTNPLKSGYIELYSDMVDESIEFWQEVKNEINNL